MQLIDSAPLGRTAGASRVTSSQGRCPQYSWCPLLPLPWPRLFTRSPICALAARLLGGLSVSLRLPAVHCAGILHGCAYAPLRLSIPPRDAVSCTCCARTPQLLLTELPKPSCLQPRTSSLATSAPRYSRSAYGRSCLLRRRGDSPSLSSDGALAAVLGISASSWDLCVVFGIMRRSTPLGAHCALRAKAAPRAALGTVNHAESSTGCGRPLYTMYDFVR
ncbi:hypothetical protein EV715DRAFT_258079, partial [Schizophyllum commune]